jgi:hypothetical protein
MSASGPKRTSLVASHMSAFGGKADITQTRCNVRHAYHERTPDQAREDNRRDREMQRLRLPLLRFTASDVVRDDAGVAHEIALFVNEKCHEKTELRAAEAERDDLLRENYLYRLGMPVC